MLNVWVILTIILATPTIWVTFYKLGKASKITEVRSALSRRLTSVYYQAIERVARDVAIYLGRKLANQEREGSTLSSLNGVPSNGVPTIHLTKSSGKRTGSL